MEGAMRPREVAGLREVAIRTRRAEQKARAAALAVDVRSFRLYVQRFRR